MSKIATQEHEAMRLAMTLHNPPAHPHWSESVEWPADRWDPMINAPRAGYPILHLRGREAGGRIVEPMHYACGGGEEQPRFEGWFVPAGDHFNNQVEPVEWQPLRAQPQSPA